MEIRHLQSVGNDDQAKRLGLEALRADALRPMPVRVDSRESAPLPAPPPSDLFEGERAFPLGNKDLIYARETWISKPMTYCSSALWASSSLISPAARRYGGGGAAAVLGLTSAFSDARDLLSSERPIEGFKYFGALTADIGITTGGIKMLTATGRRWVAPAVVLGGLVARAGCDAIPNNILKQYDENRDIKTVVESREVANDFSERIEKVYMRDIPEHVRRRMEREGYTVRVTPYLTHPQGYPELIGRQPRGYTKGSTWNEAEGTVRSERKQVLISQNRVIDNTLVPSDRVDGVFRHEYGHAVNNVFGQRGELYSDGAEFQVAYERDVVRLTAAQKSEFQYLLQPGSAGRDECFADVFAALTGGPCNGPPRRVLDPFPEVASLINRKILKRN
ncbi:MAG: hypothetical protein K2W95_14015 [Candidatus Obscuribacterales bacterium]|nr:hypothetical protein [Candidatus Obscuribacterales bacterium]